MSTEEKLHQALAQLTPGHLREIIARLARREEGQSETSVSLPSLIDALTGGEDLGAGVEGWAAQLTLKRAIMEAVALIPGARYVEGDA